MTKQIVAWVPLLALATACGGTPSSASLGPVGPSGLTGASGAALTGDARTVQASARQQVGVGMFDACDPTTFDAVLGAGACVRSGGMQFQTFIDTLTRLGFVGPWRFAPNTANVSTGATFVAQNQGGEVHTFTEVAQFGGGIVPVLNQLAHTPDVAPECTTLEGGDFVAPGSTYTEQVNTAGTVKFQCCIHPWMRLEAQVASK